MALRKIGFGWTLETASQAVPYYDFERRIWQQFGARKQGRRPNEQKWLWGVDRPGLRGDYDDDSATQEDRNG